MSRGILLVSHVEEVASGVARLLKEVAKDVPITVAGGLEDGGIGTSMDRIMAAVEENPADELFAFYDLGSAKMNLEMAMELSDKPITLYHTAFVEGAYTAGALLQVDSSTEVIEGQITPLNIKE